ncbi:hypothetical protein HNR46_002117 [Haloferula luteola]|uniref:DUF808 domain-containing protein n=1 Tax=Haloferula luteola TaxID=595692 RepID=A0A840VB20_9BACT|nr:DUF808 domain-containing protein [Haloferula luteola]MBB5351878.1 hypothetical protein [Haloferula luteola]
MAGASLWMLLDDIASILDDVSVMTKTAASKTAGVLGDDLALNAQQVSGVVAKRELPVVWGVAKGSMVNKLILVPAALALDHFIPGAIQPLLMLGGTYLCFEGVEKVLDWIQHRKRKSPEAAERKLAEAQGGANGGLDEKAKIKGAIRTDFVLSAEIIVITLGVVTQNPETSFATKAMVLAAIGVIMTIGVYGLVSCIVKLDDFGLFLSQKSGMLRKIGQAILRAAPYLMKTLSVVGTAAMFLVGGGILVHNVGPLHHGIERALDGTPGVIHGLAANGFNALCGMAAGALVLAVVHPLTKRFGKGH